MNVAEAPKGTLLKRTKSRCPICHASAPAEVIRVGDDPGQIFLNRTCAEHGEFSACIASDARFYWLAQGKPENAEGCCTPKRFSIAGSSACCASTKGFDGTLGINANGRGDAPFEKLATCLALIELVRSCNLACPTCYADSPVGAGSKTDFVPLQELKERIQSVIDRKGGIELLQLSGGEPTLHPQFFEFLEWAREHSQIDYLLLNTNGVRLATDTKFVEEMGRTFRYGGMQVYLQFDGVQEAGQKELRGVDLRAMREKAIAACASINLPVTLAMTVTHTNLPNLWVAIEFGLAHSHVRGISFQPLFTSGRNGTTTARLNTADIILGAVEQSDGTLKFEDFTPLPCGDPNCATIGYLLRINGAVHSISDFVDFTAVQGFLKNKIRYKLDDLTQCGCENEPLGEILKKFELNETHTFRLFIKPFMDAWSWDEDRIDRCCTHVIRPDGKLDSFCRYYSGFSDTKVQP